MVASFAGSTNYASADSDPVTFSIDAAQVTGLSQSIGSTAGAYTVTITGVGFTYATGVSFGGTAATSFTVNSNTSITATVPSHTRGIVDVTVTNSLGTSPTSSADEFTYVGPPLNTVPASQATPPNTNLVFSTGNSNLISIADVDAGSSTVQVTLTATHGTITLSGTSGLSFSFSDGNGTGAGDGTTDTTMTFRGTISNINAALNGLTFIPTTSYHGNASLQIVTNDLGNTGSGGALTDDDTVTIAVNTPPVTYNPGYFTFANNTLTVPTGFTDLLGTDPDSDTITIVA